MWIARSKLPRSKLLVRHLQTRGLHLQAPTLAPPLTRPSSPSLLLLSFSSPVLTPSHTSSSGLRQQCMATWLNLRSISSDLNDQTLRWPVGSVSRTHPCPRPSQPLSGASLVFNAFFQKNIHVSNFPSNSLQTSRKGRNWRILTRKIAKNIEFCPNFKKSLNFKKWPQNSWNLKERQELKEYDHPNN